MIYICASPPWSGQISILIETVKSCESPAVGEQMQLCGEMQSLFVKSQNGNDMYGIGTFYGYLYKDSGELVTYTDVSYLIYNTLPKRKAVHDVRIALFFTNLLGYDKNWPRRGDILRYDCWLQATYHMTSSGLIDNSTDDEHGSVP